jgi:molybdopterin adenylyltransferase
MYTVGILTSSDLGARGEREDTSGALLHELLAPPIYQVRRYLVLPDERAALESTLRSWADDDGLDLVVTTGGTGLTARDVMPEATLAIAERLVPGMAEAMRAYGLTKTPMAMLSRGVVAVRRRTLIVNLPGSSKGVREGMEALAPVLEHALGQLTERARGH